MAVGGLTGPVGVFPGAGVERVTPAGGRIVPVAGLAGLAGDPIAGRGVVGGRSDDVCRTELPAGGGFSVRRIEPVAGRPDGCAGAREGVTGLAGVGVLPDDEGRMPERGKSVTRGVGERGGTGR